MSRAGMVLGLGLAGWAAVAPSSAPVRAASRPGYAGDTECVTCHKEQGLSFLHTAHHRTSEVAAAAGPGAVLGSFGGRRGTLTIVDPAEVTGEPGLLFTMSARNGGFFETASTGFAGGMQQRTERIDIVTGSGERGQTFLSWQGDRLFELPVSYWADGARWINSPGYVDGTADFARPIHPGCVECHASYLQPLSSDPGTNRFVRESFVPGVGCETCHGPGAAHVELHAGGRKKAGEEMILNPARFSRERQIDLCALCHNGIQREPLAPAFSYRPGKPLREFFRPLPVAAVEHPDVHGDQVGLLQRSRCYTESPAMTCSTCHNTHEGERPAASYSARCLTCHTWQSCGVAKTLGHRIASDCIDCHMPVEATAAIVSETAGQEVHASMRNHWIKVYPGAKLP